MLSPSSPDRVRLVGLLAVGYLFLGLFSGCSPPDSNGPGTAGDGTGGGVEGGASGGSSGRGSGGRAGTGGGTGGGTTGTGGATAGSGGAGPGSGGAAPATGSGGDSGSGGAAAGSGGAARGTGGRTAGSGGGPAGSGGRAGTGGAGGAGTPAGTGGRSGSGGAAAGSGGRAGTGGAPAGTGGSGTTTCGSTTPNQNPFGCKFAWGTNDPGGSLTSYSYLQFMSYWVDSGLKADGSIPTCNGCNWLSTQVAQTSLVPVYYAYFIGYYGHANGLPDGNVGGPPNLTTGGAALIRSHRATIVDMYRTYAQQTYQVWKTRPLVWLLEGDMIQYSSDSTSQVDSSNKQDGLSFAELAQLTADITCAIKSGMPNAVVAINHTTWNSDGATNGFWGAMKTAGVNYDMVWTTGEATANGFLNSSSNSGSYNGATATFAYVHQLTAKTIFVDTSFGASAMGDSWSNATAAQLNARIADGVVAANVTGSVPASYATAIATLGPSLNTTCH